MGTTTSPPPLHWALPPSILASPPRSHTVPPALAPGAAWWGQSLPPHPGEDNTNLLCICHPATARTDRTPASTAWQPHRDMAAPQHCCTPLTSRGQAWWRGRGIQGLGHCSWHLGCSSSWHWWHLMAAFPKRRREPHTPHGSGRITWRGGTGSGAPFLADNPVLLLHPPKPAPTAFIQPMCRQRWGGGKLCPPLSSPAPTAWLLSP